MKKQNRYLMGYSQAESGWMVVYAHTKDEAVAKFESGDFQIEDNDCE